MLGRLATMVLLLVTAACVGLPPVPVSSKLFGRDSTLVGFVDLLETRGGVEVRLHTLGLPPGKHGINLHTTASCEPPDFASAGPVVHPTGRKSDSLALGDLPDFTSLGADWSDTTFIWPGLELNDGDHGVFHNGGTALVITAEPDQGREPGSGERIACGVLTPRPEKR